MKTFELLNEASAWKELSFYQYTPAQLNLLNAPNTEENKQTKIDMMAEIEALSKLEVSEEDAAKLTAEYEFQKSKIEGLASDYELKWANFTEHEGKFAGRIFFFNDNKYGTHEFIPAKVESTEETTPTV